MVACGYGISLLVFNSTSHLFVIELNTRRGIPYLYLRAPMRYSLCVFSITNVFNILRKSMILMCKKIFLIYAVNTFFPFCSRLPEVGYSQF